MDSPYAYILPDHISRHLETGRDAIRRAAIAGVLC